MSKSKKNTSTRLLLVQVATTTNDSIKKNSSEANAKNSKKYFTARSKDSQCHNNIKNPCNPNKLSKAFIKNNHANLFCQNAPNFQYSIKRTYHL